MKKIRSKKWQFILSAIFSLLTYSLFSQTVHIGYDAAGNRIFLYTETDRTMSTGGQEIHFKTPPFIKKPEKEIEELFSVNPNPSDDVVVLSSKTKSEEGVKYSLGLYDATGRLIVQYPKIQIPFTLDIATYPAGLYFLKVSDTNTLQTIKVMKK